MFTSLDDYLSFLSTVNYVEFTKLMSPEEVIMSKQGSCHDQAMLSLDVLQGLGYFPYAKFIIAVDEEDQGQETHSFVYFRNNRSWYWIENAWSEFQGVHQYSLYNDMIDAIMFAFGQRNPYVKLYIADLTPSDHTYGEDLQTFVDICMNSAEEYKVR